MLDKKVFYTKTSLTSITQQGLETYKILQIREIRETKWVMDALKNSLYPSPIPHLFAPIPHLFAPITHLFVSLSLINSA